MWQLTLAYCQQTLIYRHNSNIWNYKKFKVKYDITMLQRYGYLKFIDQTAVEEKESKILLLWYILLKFKCFREVITKLYTKFNLLFQCFGDNRVAKISVNLFCVLCNLQEILLANFRNTINWFVFKNDIFQLQSTLKCWLIIKYLEKYIF